MVTVEADSDSKVLDSKFLEFGRSNVTCNLRPLVIRSESIQPDNGGVSCCAVQVKWLSDFCI